jgi:UDP:flavonoid glycosyltransferase YjiC (YdhE family)
LRRTVKQLAAAKISAPGGLAHLPAELSNCGVLVHLGSCGMAMAGIAAGVPQVMIKTDLEKTLIARAITARNAGTVLSWSRFEAPELASAIRNAVESEAMQKAARDLSLENAPYLRIDPVDKITKGIMRILGG